jgi:hypothetical protein
MNMATMTLPRRPFGTSSDAISLVLKGLKPRGRYIGMAEPFLDLGDIGIVRESVAGRGGAEGMNAQAVVGGEWQCLLTGSGVSP